jgi:PAS domain S-box-containing protein
LKNPENFTPETLTADESVARVPLEHSMHWVESLAEASGRAVIFVDDRWRIDYWSLRAEHLLGWGAAQVIGKGLGTVLGIPSERSRLLREAFEASPPLNNEHITLHKAGGSSIEVTISIRPLPGSAPDKGCLVTLGDDAEAAANVEFRKFFQVVDQSRSGVLLTNPEGLIEYANPRAGKILGCTSAQLFGASVLPRFDTQPPSIPLLPHEAAHQAEWRGEWRGDQRIERPDGITLDLHIALSQVRDVTGEVANRVIQFEDITERRALEAEQQELRDGMAHAGQMAALGEMATTIAHEVNQPLTAIANYSQGSLRRLDAGNTDMAPILFALREIVDQVKRAGGIIQNVRRLARRQETKMDAVDIRQLIAQLLPMIRMSADALDVKVISETTARNTVALANETHFSQILLNLAKNGIDAMAETPKNGRVLTIRLADLDDTPSAEHLRVSVSDRGCGIADNDLARLGTPFFTLKPEGLGLGLSTVRTLLEAHGSRLEIFRNAPDEPGMTFIFTLEKAGMTRP